jgi:excisionase family DNA binding protein
MDRKAPRRLAASHYGVTVRTIDAWISKGYIRAWRIGNGAIVVDLNDVDEALKTHTRMEMRASANRYGPDARIVDAPNIVMAEVAP